MLSEISILQSRNLNEDIVEDFIVNTRDFILRNIYYVIVIFIAFFYIL